MLKREELLKLTKEEIVDLLLPIISQLTEKVKELTEKVSVLEARLNQNSGNSSNPPSRDIFKKPKTKRTSSGKKPGGQEGHKGSGFTQIGTPDKYIMHEPKACTQCANYSKCQAERIVDQTRYEVDIVIQTKTTAHQTARVRCPESGKMLLGDFPEGINNTMQYGVNLNALAVSLNTVGMVSINRTHEILSGVFGIPISTGTIFSMVENCAEKIKDPVQEIKEAIIREPIIHNDETGTRVDKKTVWAHVSSTPDLTYIGINPKRGKEGMDEIGVLTEFQGISIHDCWASYFKYEDITHGLCNAHVLRELIAVTENTSQAWAQQLIDLLLSMKQFKEGLITQGIGAAPEDVWREYSQKYDTLLQEALAQNPIPIPDGKSKRKQKRGKTGALVDRLILRKSQWLLFFTDFNVPFDNNQAERDIRMFKVKQKVSGCFRTMEGAKNFAAISSFIGTARKRQISAFHAIKDAILGKPFSVELVGTD